MNVEKIRKDFPVLEQEPKPIYFDNACQSLRPRIVIEKMQEYYNKYPACAGRSWHEWGQKVTEEIKKARTIAQKFFNARSPDEIIFTKNTTEGINLVANCLELKNKKVIISDKEHNSNLLPWQKLAKTGIKFETAKFGDMEDLKKKINGAGLVSMTMTSNADGTSIPAKEIIEIAHKNGALVLLDAAQSAPHQEINVKKLDADFLACSGHKMLGPSGTGILYGKKELLDKMPQFMVGGETVKDSTYTTSEPEKAPEKFEAGLQNYSGIIGLGAAMDYLKKIGLDEIHRHEIALNKKITDAIGDKVQLIGPKDAEKRSGIFSFNINKMNPHDVSMLLSKSHNIMTRSGMHCVHSWFHANNLPGSCRASLYLYNTEEECDVFIEAVKKLLAF
ncbi:MAG: cysteine desulfurase [Candidatus Woesearchaeota archaeon]